MPLHHANNNQKAGSLAGKRQLTRPEQNSAAWKRWTKAARKFKSVDLRLRAREELRNIGRIQSGYQVRLMRGWKCIFNRTVHGHSEKSLLEAVRLRDEALRNLATTRKHPIPERVLSAVGLTSPVSGIYRSPVRSVYRVEYKRKDGGRHARYFYYRVIPEEDAYAAALAFLQSKLK